MVTRPSASSRKAATVRAARHATDSSRLPLVASAPAPAAAVNFCCGVRAAAQGIINERERARKRKEEEKRTVAYNKEEYNTHRAKEKRLGLRSKKETERLCWWSVIARR